MKQIRSTLFAIIIVSVSYSQENTSADTVGLARSKAYSQQFHEAERLLRLYTSTKNDLNAFRLQAQVLYWMKDFKQSAAVLQKALAAFPGETILYLDYGRLLYNTGNITTSEKYLLNYQQTDSLHAETNLMLAHIWFWQGRFKEAAGLTKNIVKTYPDQQDALNLLNEINFIRAVYVKVNAATLSDDQPLSSQQVTVETGACRSAFFAPKLKLTSFNFQTDQQSSFNWWLQTGNTFSSGKNGLSLSLVGGLFQSTGTINVTGEVLLSKKIGRFVTADAMVAYKPYQLTVAAARKAVMQTVYAGSFQYNQNNKWIGKAIYEVQQFPDNNQIYTAYAWLSAPIIHKEKFLLHTGYAFAWQTTAKNKAMYKEPLPPLAVIYNNGLQVQTVYDPYFTPLNQFVNSLLLSTKIFISKKVAFSLRGSFGFLAQAEVPYYYVQFTPPQYQLNKDFTVHQFNPAELFAGLELQPGKQFQLQFNYQYNAVLFYKLHQGSIQLNYRFYHEKKQ